MQLSRFWTLLNKILREDHEISSFLSKNFRKIRLAFSLRFPHRYLFKVLLVVSTSHVLSFSLGAKPFPGLSPRQGRQNSICIALAALFRKFRPSSASWRGPWSCSISARKKFSDLSLTGRIRSYMQLSRFWTLLSKILRQDREISSFLSKNFRDFRLAFWPRFVLRLCYKVLLFEI